MANPLPATQASPKGQVRQARDMPPSLAAELLPSALQPPRERAENGVERGDVKFGVDLKSGIPPPFPIVLLCLSWRWERGKVLWMQHCWLAARVMGYSITCSPLLSVPKYPGH